jgi:hypothetical protein
MGLSTNSACDPSGLPIRDFVTLGFQVLDLI